MNNEIRIINVELKEQQKMLEELDEAPTFLCAILQCTVSSALLAVDMEVFNDKWIVFKCFPFFSKATLILQDIDKEAEKLNFVWKPRAGPWPFGGLPHVTCTTKTSRNKRHGKCHE